MSANYRDFGRMIKRARVDANLTQGELAKELGYSSPQFISNAERGLCTLPLHSIRKICDLCGLDRQKMFKFLIDAEAKRVRKGLQC